MTPPPLTTAAGLSDMDALTGRARSFAGFLSDFAQRVAEGMAPHFAAHDATVARIMADHEARLAAIDAKYSHLSGGL
jgi:hypothetical protein